MTTSFIHWNFGRCSFFPRCVFVFQESEGNSTIIDADSTAKHDILKESVGIELDEALVMVKEVQDVSVNLQTAIRKEQTELERVLANKIEADSVLANLKDERVELERDVAKLRADKEDELAKEASDAIF